MTKIKICGLTNVTEIEYVNEYLPDYVGFVFAKSKRQVSLQQAMQLKSHLRKEIQSVGVFVQAPIQQISQICKEHIIDYVQLHGEESLDYIKELRKEISVPIIYAKRIKSREDAICCESLPVEYLLFDSYVEGVYGGSGTLLDYRQIPKLEKPYFLAGGLNGKNISHVLQEVAPFCVDVSSGVEGDHGKDKRKIEQFITCVRSMRGDS